MTHDERAGRYLRDLGAILADLALTTKREYQFGLSADDGRYLLGRLTAMHQVISLMQHQAIAFEIPLGDLSLEDIDPESDLL